MSEELADEVEAINSIYGEGSIVQSNDDPSVYVLSLPGETSSLRVQFPPSYPSESLSVLGTHSSGEHGKRGTAARDLDLFREAVGTAYQPGQVCLFDAIEELTRLLKPYAAEDEAQVQEESNDLNETIAVIEPKDSGLPAAEIQWILSEPVVELKSTFIARCTTVTSPHEANHFVENLLASDKKVRAATHNITAWRIKGPNNTSFQDCNDDGETAAGGRLLHLMQLMDLWDTMVVVTRWYGGQKLGPRRFAVINQVARDAFVKAGLVTETTTKKKPHVK